MKTAHDSQKGHFTALSTSSVSEKKVNFLIDFAKRFSNEKALWKFKLID